jgi:TPR repeat protein
MRATAGLAFIALLLVAAPSVAAELHACDRLAANPPDPDRVTVGVERKDVDLPKAIAACRQAVQAHPDVPRFSYQLGRVLFYDNQVAPALASFQRAADAGYRQARFMIGLLMTRKYAGVPQDECKVAVLWTAAARQGHGNAAVSYVRDALRGRFQACSPQADRDEMRRFLKASEPGADYLGKLLIEDLEAKLNSPEGPGGK